MLGNALRVSETMWDSLRPLKQAETKPSLGKFRPLLTAQIMEKKHPDGVITQFVVQCIVKCVD